MNSNKSGKARNFESVDMNKAVEMLYAGGWIVKIKSRGKEVLIKTKGSTYPSRIKTEFSSILYTVPIIYADRKSWFIKEYESQEIIEHSKPYKSMDQRMDQNLDQFSTNNSAPRHDVEDVKVLWFGSDVSPQCLVKKF